MKTITLRAILLLLPVLPAAYAQPAYDLLLKGGHVIDPRNNIDAVRDVAVSNGRIAAVEASIPADRAKKVIDVRGLYVTPGLVDIHVHVYLVTGQPNYTGELSVFPDDHSFRSCTTTMVDAGTAGWANFDDFRDRIIKRASTRVLAFLNIVAHGMGGDKVEQDLNEMDAKKTAEKALANRDLIVGIKTAHYAGPGWEAVDRALEAAREVKVPIMVDFGVFRPERPFSQLVLERLRPGDIYTHTYLDRVPMLDDNGKLQPFMFQARKRGVIFDAGHGGGSFIFRYAVPATQQGFYPDSISTDLHAGSRNAGMKDMVNVMSKFLNLKMPLKDVIRASTWNPAREIHREEYGHLSVGAVADIAALRHLKGDFGFIDVRNRSMKGSEKLGCELTIAGGQVRYDLNARAAEPWDAKK